MDSDSVNLGSNPSGASSTTGPPSHWRAAGDRGGVARWAAPNVEMTKDFLALNNAVILRFCKGELEAHL